MRSLRLFRLNLLLTNKFMKRKEKASPYRSIEFILYFKDFLNENKSKMNYITQISRRCSVGLDMVCSDLVLLILYKMQKINDA